MANPIYQGHGGLGTQVTDNTDLIVTLPSGIQAGDILIANVMNTDNSVAVTPSGWTVIHQVLTGGSGTYCYASYWRRATSAESGTVTFAAVAAWAGLFMGIIHRFTGCIETGTPYESVLAVPTGTPTTGTTKVITPTAPTGADRLGIVLGICEDDTVTSIAGTGWTQQYLLQTTDGTDGAMTMATKNLSSGDSVGTVTLTMNISSDYASVVSMMLLPAAVVTNIVNINVGDVWKNMVGSQINVGDVWKTVASIKINVGDVWKTVQ